MSRLSSKQTDEAKSLPMMNLGVELPEFDKTKYPHGGYGQLHSFGWRILDQKEYRKPEKTCRIIRYEDLPGVGSKNPCIKLETLARPKQGEGYLFDQHLGPEYHIFAYRNGELRYGIVTEGDCMDMSIEYFYLEDGLFAVEPSIEDYHRFGEALEDFTSEYAKPYFLQQVETVAMNGQLNGEDFLRVALFRHDMIEPLVEHSVKIIDFPNTFEGVKKVSSIIWGAALYAKGVETSDTVREIFNLVSEDICTKMELCQIWNDQYHLSEILFNRLSQREMLSVAPPKELCELCARWMQVPDGKEVYNPFSSSGGLAVAMHNASVLGDEKDMFLSEVALARTEGAPCFCWVDRKDPFEGLSDRSKSYDYIAFIAPLTLTDKERSTAIDLALSKLNDNGQMVCVLPQSFTYAPKYSPVRNRILNEGKQVEVVSLPSLYSPYSATELCLLRVEKKNNVGEQCYLYFMDGTSFFHKDKNSNHRQLLVDSLLEEWHMRTEKVTFMERGEFMGNNLTPARHLVQRHIKMHPQYMPLKKLVSPIEPDSSNVLLISTAGVLKCRVGIPDDKAKHVVAVKANTAVVDEDYLLQELQSAYVQRQFFAYATGTSVKRISYKDLMDIRISVPSLEEQRATVTAFLKHGLAESERKVREQFELYRKEIRVRKHAIVQNLSAMNAQWNALNKFRQQHDGTLRDTDLVGRINPRPVATLFNSIDAFFQTLNNQAHHLAEVEYDWGEAELLSPMKYLREYCKSHSNDLFAFRVEGEESREISIKIPRRAMQQVLDNIVTNAITHGFTDTSERHRDYHIVFSVSTEKDKVVLLVANNGKPLTMDPANVFSYGLSSALNEEYRTENGTHAVHSGIGGHDIREILKDYGADVSIRGIDPKENDGYTVVYRIEFENVI